MAIRIKLLVSIIAILGISMFGSFGVVNAEEQITNHGVNIYFFWGSGCPHCAKAKPVLQDIANSNDNVELQSFEVYYNFDNQKLLLAVADKLKIDASGVPVTIIGDEATIGYSESMEQAIRDKVKSCSVNKCPDSIAELAGVSVPIDTLTSPPEVTEVTNKQDENNVETIDLPLLGTVKVSDFSLPILTIVIAALDGFNPCAMWTLLFLISVLLGMKSRRRMWALGGAFIVSSAFVYFMFMTAWLNIFLFIGYVAWVKIIIGILALGSGAYYLYDYYQNSSGSCKVTGGAKRKMVFEKIRAITHEKSFWIALVGIIILAFAVNLVELVCSAGLPAIYTHVLSLSDLQPWQYYGYLVLYILVFMADDLFVFFVAMFTLKMVGVHTKYAHYARLVGSIVMIILGILLLFAPQLLMFG